MSKEWQTRDGQNRCWSGCHQEGVREEDRRNPECSGRERNARRTVVDTEKWQLGIGRCQ